jgi:hypothetical protein
MPMLVVSPAAVDFGPNLSVQRTYKENFTVTNTLSSPVVFSLRASAPGRLSITPVECSLEAGETIELQIKLQVPVGTTSKQPRQFRDTIFIQSTYFQQKVNVSFGISSDSFAASTPVSSTARGGNASLVTTTGSKTGKNVHTTDAQDAPGFGISGYRALLQAEFEEKSEKVLRLLEAKDETISSLEERLALSTAELETCRRESLSVKTELEAM